MDAGTHKDLAREVLSEVGRGLPDPGIGSGRLVELATEEAERRGDPELATDRGFLEIMARRQFAGALGGKVLDLT